MPSDHGPVVAQHREQYCNPENTVSSVLQGGFRNSITCLSHPTAIIPDLQSRLFVNLVRVPTPNGTLYGAFSMTIHVSVCMC